MVSLRFLTHIPSGVVSPVEAPPGARQTDGDVHAIVRLGRLRSRARLLVALVGALAILGTQQFLTVHALQHLGQTDHTHCEYAPLAATASGGVLIAAVALAIPCLSARVETLPLRQFPACVAPAKACARAPPLV